MLAVTYRGMLKAFARLCRGWQQSTAQHKCSKAGGPLNARAWPAGRCSRAAATALGRPPPLAPPPAPLPAAAPAGQAARHRCCQAAWGCAGWESDLGLGAAESHAEGGPPLQVMGQGWEKLEARVKKKTGLGSGKRAGG